MNANRLPEGGFFCLTVYWILVLALLHPLSAKAADEAAHAQSPLAHKRVLLLFSYHPTFPTAPQVVEGVKSIFGKEGPSLDLEYMDSKRLYDEISRERFHALLSYKLQHRPLYDLVITADDNALHFLLDHKETLFQGIPAVFLGVNDRELAESLEDNPEITGVVEAASFQETLELTGRLQPALTQLFVIVDGTTSGQADLRTVKRLTRTEGPFNLQVLSLTEMSWQQLSERLGGISSQDAILLLSAYHDAEKTALSFEEGLALIYASANAPIYHLWEHGMGQGVMGGIIISHHEQGRRAAMLAREILLGKEIASLPVVSESPNIPIFDVRELKRFSIPVSALPAGSQIRFKDTSLLATYRMEITAIVTLFAFMAMVIGFLFYQNRLRSSHSRSLAEKEKTQRNILDNLDAYIYLKDLDGNYLFANRCVRDLWNKSLREIIGKSDFAFFSKDTAEAIQQNDREVIRLRKPLRLLEENWLPGATKPSVFQSTKFPLRNNEGEAVALCGISVDITELKEHEQQLEQMAHYDSLTGLANRLLLTDRLTHAMADAERYGNALAVVYIDLDGFKEVNDTHDHHVGDRLLQVIAARMKDIVRDSDTLARLGGDEFVAVLNHFQQEQQGAMLLDRLLEAIQKPIEIDGKRLQISASFGVSVFPQKDGIDPDQLLRQADQAMYTAKTRGKNQYHYFDEAVELRARAQEAEINRLRQALKQREFVLFYQPKVDLRTGKILGAEALLRWQHPEQGLLAPASFLPRLNRHPFSVELGEWVIDEALRQLQAWCIEGLDLSVSVNLFHLQLEQESFVEVLQHHLAVYPDVPPTLLEFEIIETDALRDIEVVSMIVKHCAELGIRFHIDDFGTGYASLAYLRKLPVHSLKIDRSFVQGMHEQADDQAIVEAIIRLGQAFQVDIIAEGVERIEHGQLLMQLGCHVLQGYRISRPVPADELVMWLQEWSLPPEWTMPEHSRQIQGR